MSRYQLVATDALPPNWVFALDTLFDGDLHCECNRDVCAACTRSYFLIERTDEEPGMPRRVRRP